MDQISDYTSSLSFSHYFESPRCNTKWWLIPTDGGHLVVAVGLMGSEDPADSTF